VRKKVGGFELKGFSEFHEKVIAGGLSLDFPVYPADQIG